MTGIRNDSIFWIEIDKIKPNPYQPRRDFDEARLRDLAESIRQYGVLQPLVATRSENVHDDGSMSAEYELIAGERRLRAAKLAGLSQVPLIIRTGEDQNRLKLELAIIENLQREDLNPIDRAMAFQRLAEEFNNRHAEIGKKIGKSREYISNTIRLLTLPREIQQALSEGKISEGHARTLLMLSDKTEEQNTLYREIVQKRLTVRETESIARRIAVDRLRKKESLDPAMLELEKKLTETLGTRVHIEPREQGGKIHIDYFSPEDLEGITSRLSGHETAEEKRSFLGRFLGSDGEQRGESSEDKPESTETPDEKAPPKEEGSEDAAQDDRAAVEREKESEDLYSVKNFSI